MSLAPSRPVAFVLAQHRDRRGLSRAVDQLRYRFTDLVDIFLRAGDVSVGKFEHDLLVGLEFEDIPVVAILFVRAGTKQLINYLLDQFFILGMPGCLELVSY